MRKRGAVAGRALCRRIAARRGALGCPGYARRACAGRYAQPCAGDAALVASQVIGPFGIKTWLQTRLLVHPNGEVTIWFRNNATGAVERQRYRLLAGRPLEVWVEE